MLGIPIGDPMVFATIGSWPSRWLLPLISNKPSSWLDLFIAMNCNCLWTNRLQPCFFCGHVSLLVIHPPRIRCRNSGAETASPPHCRGGSRGLARRLTSSRAEVPSPRWAKSRDPGMESRSSRCSSHLDCYLYIYIYIHICIYTYVPSVICCCSYCWESSIWFDHCSYYNTYSSAPNVPWRLFVGDRAIRGWKVHPIRRIVSKPLPGLILWWNMLKTMQPSKNVG